MAVVNSNHSRSFKDEEADIEIGIIQLFKRQFDEDSFSMEPEKLSDFVFKYIL